MHPKIKRRPVDGSRSLRTVKPLLLHDVTNQAGSANAASRRKQLPVQPLSGAANHARHHVSPGAQS